MIGITFFTMIISMLASAGWTLICLQIKDILFSIGTPGVIYWIIIYSSGFIVISVIAWLVSREASRRLM